MTTPVNGLTELTAAQSQPHLPVNTALRFFDAAANLSVLGMVAAPAGGEATGVLDLRLHERRGAVDHRLRQRQVADAIDEAVVQAFGEDELVAAA